MRLGKGEVSSWSQRVLLFSGFSCRFSWKYPYLSLSFRCRLLSGSVRVSRTFRRPANERSRWEKRREDSENGQRLYVCYFESLREARVNLDHSREMVSCSVDALTDTRTKYIKSTERNVVVLTKVRPELFVPESSEFHVFLALLHVRVELDSFHYIVALFVVILYLVLIRWNQLGVTIDDELFIKRWLCVLTQFKLC